MERGLFNILKGAALTAEDTFDVFYKTLEDTVALNVNNWVLLTEPKLMVHTGLARYGVRRGIFYKSADEVDRRMILASTDFGNVVVYEPYADMRGQRLRLVAPARVQDYMGLRPTSNLTTKEELLMLFNMGFKASDWKAKVTALSHELYPQIPKVKHV